MRIVTKTKLAPKDVIQKAIDFFGPMGYKLKHVSQTDSSLRFEGGGGSVELDISEENGKTNVDFLSFEWDYQVKEFIHTIR